MPTLPAASVDAILADLPYGTTRCAWDSVIPFEPLWSCFARLLRPGGVVLLTATQPFASALVMSRPDWFRYEWVWDKVNRMSGHLNAKRQPLRITESVLVFAPSAPRTYNPQMIQGEPYRSSHAAEPTGNIYKFQGRAVTECRDGLRYPQNLIRIKADQRGTEGRVHPSQKPVDLARYLLRTHTRPGDTVLDPCMGSGFAGIAARELGRRFIGIERDAGYYALACGRICPTDDTAANDDALPLAA